MKKTLLTFASTLVFSVSAAAPMIEVNDCMIKATIPGAKATGAYFTINKEGDDATLLEVKAPDITNDVEIHEMVMGDGKMVMKKMENFPLKEGENVFKPGGYHIMLMGAKDLKADEVYSLELIFDQGDSLTCDATVKSVEAMNEMKKSMHKAH